MGFFRVVNENEMDQEKLTQLWTPSPEEKITDGQKVIVPRDNIMLYIRDNKVCDVITEPGGYIYHSNIESDPAAAEYTALFDEYLTKYEGLFGEKELTFIQHSERITSTEQVRVLLSELAERAFPSEAPEPVPEQTPTTPEPVPLQESAPAYTPPPQPAPIPVQNAGAVWNCASCGTQNDRKFCKKCGAPRPQQTAVPVQNTGDSWFCTSCGTQNNRKFCKKCGTPRPF